MKPPECRILHNLPYSFGGPRRPQTPGLIFFASLLSMFTYFFKITFYFWKCWKPWFWVFFVKHLMLGIVCFYSEIACNNVFYDLFFIIGNTYINDWGSSFVSVSETLFEPSNSLDNQFLNKNPFKFYVYAFTFCSMRGILGSNWGLQSCCCEYYKLIFLHICQNTRICELLL